MKTKTKSPLAAHIIEAQLVLVEAEMEANTDRTAHRTQTKVGQYWDDDDDDDDELHLLKNC